MAPFDMEILDKQGLQLNEDGSFSKSPRLEFEQLPFVTREYRNLQFQKRKTYESSKKSNRKIKVKSKELWRQYQEKLISEVSTERSSLTSCTLSTSRSAKNKNLTDAMKEILLQKHMENSPRRKNDGGDVTEKFVSLKQTNDGGKDGAKGWRSAKVESVTKLPQLCPVGKGNSPAVTKSKEETHQPQVVHLDAKPSRFKVFRNQSDNMLNGFRPQLSYLERRQKEVGFNPLYLRYNFSKSLSDTNRSTYGDSVAGELPEISSRTMSTGRISANDVDEEEEEFYRKLIENDKIVRRGTRSEAQLKTTRTVDLSGSNSCKNQMELTQQKKKSSGYKGAKLTAIDMPVEVTPLTYSSKKNCHYCSLNCSSSSAATKAELALKSRAYGSMVNARNVYRLKNRSVGKSLGRNKPKATNVATPEEKLVDRRHTEVVPAAKISQEKMAKVEKISSRLQSDSKERVKCNGKVEGEAKRSFFLPRFSARSGKEGEFATEILQQMRYCLGQDIPYDNFRRTKAMERHPTQVL
ncbi:hypothetical protein RUM43_006103 [Polyplax serrata]|uniref:Uncharacterized protein n=1 Tax=Polyplax serrata TaxID=468196 RepID=A0AAN8NXT1_POLSC